jgi:hypothetical protein
MIKSPEIKVDPNVLKTLRESSGYTVEEIAKKLRPLLLKYKKLKIDLPHLLWKSGKRGQADLLMDW